MKKVRSSIALVVSRASSNEAVATVVQNGKVTAVSQGTVFVTATTKSGLKSVCYIKVPAGG